MDLLDRLAAESDLRQLIAIYPQHADDGDAEGFASLFAPDGVIVIGDERIAGRAAIGQWLLGTIKKPTRHIMVNPYLVVDDAEHAHGSMDMELLRKGDDGWRLRSTIRYADSFVRTDEGWKFAQRELKLR